MKEQRKRTALAILLAVLFLFGAGMMLRKQIQYRQIVVDADEAAEIAGLRETSAPTGTPIQQEAYAEPESPHLPKFAAALMDIDLEALRSVNEEVVGWIEIPGTELSYPLMQGEDNQFYISHNWKREASSGGAVFLEAASSPDLTDFHTVAYAHRMRNGTMFGTLKYYREPDFWREHPDIYVAADDGIYCYHIFSVQEVDVKGIVYRLDIEESHLEEEFLQYCTENSVLDTGIVPKPEDRILTLSTCIGIGYTTRWVIHGVLRETYQRENGGTS